MSNIKAYKDHFEEPHCCVCITFLIISISKGKFRNWSITLRHLEIWKGLLHSLEQTLEWSRINSGKAKGWSRVGSSLFWPEIPQVSLYYFHLHSPNTYSVCLSREQWKSPHQKSTHIHTCATYRWAWAPQSGKLNPWEKNNIREGASDIR